MLVYQRVSHQHPTEAPRHLHFLAFFANILGGEICIETEDLIPVHPC